MGFALKVWQRWYVNSYDQLAWFWLSDVPFFSVLYVNVDDPKAWIVSSLPFADFIAPADCSSWEVRLHQPMVLGRTDVAVAPGGHHHRLPSSRWPLFILSPWGHWRLWARLLNYYSSPLESPMVVIVSPTLWPVSTWTSAAMRRQPAAALCYWLPLRLQPASMACLYTHGLPLRLRPAFLIFIILPSSSSSSLSIPCSSGTSIFLFYVIYMYFFSFFFLKINFPFPLQIVQKKDVIFYCCWFSTCHVAPFHDCFILLKCADPPLA